MATTAARGRTVRLGKGAAVAQASQKSGSEIHEARVVRVNDLKGLIPDASMKERYIHRQIGGKDDFEVFRYARKERRNILIEGPTGPGKTTAIEAYGATDGLPVYSVSCANGMDKAEMFGKWQPAADGSYVWQDGPITAMARAGGVLLLNEFNFIPSKMASILFPVLDYRRIIILTDHQGEIIHAHPDFQVFADMNPGYEGTRELNHALRNRFAIKIQWDYDTKVEEALVESAALLGLAQKIRLRNAAGDFDSPVSTNMLMEFEKMANDVGFDFAVSNFIAGFADPTERDSVKSLLDLEKTNIRNELFPPVRKPEASQQVNGDFDTDQEAEFDDDLWAFKKTLPDGTVVYQDEDMPDGTWVTFDKLQEARA